MTAARPVPSCPWVVTSGGGTSFCRLAEAPQPKVLWEGEVRGLIALLRLGGECGERTLATIPLTPGSRIAVVALAAPGAVAGEPESEEATGG